MSDFFKSLYESKGYVQKAITDNVIDAEAIDFLEKGKSDPVGTVKKYKKTEFKKKEDGTWEANVKAASEGDDDEDTGAEGVGEGDGSGE